jgi:hypothetical protein
LLSYRLRTYSEKSVQCLYNLWKKSSFLPCLMSKLYLHFYEICCWLEKPEYKCLSQIQNKFKSASCNVCIKDINISNIGGRVDLKVTFSQQSTLWVNFFVGWTLAGSTWLLTHIDSLKLLFFLMFRVLCWLNVTFKSTLPPILLMLISPYFKNDSFHIQIQHVVVFATKWLETLLLKLNGLKSQNISVCLKYRTNRLLQ